MEGVPWPKPTVLHAARRLAGGGSAYDDRLIRSRLAQAFGRLIRRADDRGSFVILSAAMPSRLITAFPEGVPIRRVTLEEAILFVSSRLSSETSFGHKAQDASRVESYLKRLTLLRHAKSSWYEHVSRNFDRTI